MNEDSDHTTLALQVPYKVARALEVVRSKDPTRYNLCDVGLTASDHLLWLYATDGHRALKLEIPNPGLDPGRYILPGDDIKRLAKTGAGILRHSDRVLVPNVEPEEAKYPDVEQVIPTRYRTAAQVIGFDPEYLRSLADVFKELGRESVPKGSDSGLKRLSAQANRPVSWCQGDALSPVKVTWDFALSDFESPDGQPRLNCHATFIIMPMRLD